MKKMVNALLYSLLLAVALAGMIGIRYFIVQEQERVELVEERRLAAEIEKEKEISASNDEKPTENSGIVLVKKLPIYKQKKIVKAKTNADMQILSYGDEVTILQKDGLYTKIRTKNGETGYVWSDCMSEQSAQEVQADVRPKVVFLAVSAQELSDRELGLELAETLEKKLEQRGYLVVMASRKQEDALSDAKSTELANQIKADVVIHLGIGVDSSEDPTVDKAAVYCLAGDSQYPAAKYHTDSKKLGKKVLKYYTKAVGFDSAGVLESDEYSCIQQYKRPAILLKLGELADEGQKLQAKMARGIADGVDAYFLTVSK